MFDAILSLPDRAFFQRMIIGVILINALILGMLTDTSLSEETVSLLETLDMICLVVFCFELILKLLGQRLGFFRDAWNVFDFLVVGVALVPGSGPLAVLRALRVFRLMRLIKVVPSMRRVVNGMFAAIPGVASVIGVLLVFLYVAAIMAVNFFSEVDSENFGGLATTFFTLFQFLTMEGWPDVARPVIEQMPHSWIFFIPFILLTTFTTLNLLFGIIVESMERAKEEEVRDAMALQGISAEDETDEMRLLMIEQEMESIRRRIKALTVNMQVE